MGWSATAECDGGACKGGEKKFLRTISASSQQCPNKFGTAFGLHEMSTRAVGIYWRSLAEGEGVEFF